MRYRILAGLVLAGLLLAAGVSSRSIAARAAAPQTDQLERLQAELTRLGNDWADLGRYRDANAHLAPPMPRENRVVFMGDSITDFWSQRSPGFFQGRPYINRGISGQTTPQMLVRFRPDVINLQPKVVVILAGTNDIAGNTGPATRPEIEGNLESMAELARASGIRVVLSSVLPVYDYPWKPGLQPAPKIVALNQWIHQFARRNHMVYLDYYSAMVDSRGGLKPALTVDGVHPNAAGYAVMEPLAVRAIARSLRQRP